MDRGVDKYINDKYINCTFIKEICLFSKSMTCSTLCTVEMFLNIKLHKLEKNNH